MAYNRNTYEAGTPVAERPEPGYYPPDSKSLKDANDVSVVEKNVNGDHEPQGGAHMHRALKGRQV